MPHAHTNLLVHVVFSTKDRAALIPPELLPRLWNYVEGIGRNLHVPILAVGGIENHVHLLTAIPPAIACAEFVQKVKANSSRWMGEHRRAFSWQEGYGAFSVSASQKENAVTYVRNQRAHHRKHSFEDEYRSLLIKCGVSFDPDELFPRAVLTDSATK